MNNKKNPKFDLAVVGGGVAGLIFASEAARAGQKVLVLEAEHEIGGAVGAATLAGVEVATGAEAFAVAGGKMRELVSRLGLDDQVVTPAANASYIVKDPAGAQAKAYQSPKYAVMGLPARSMFNRQNLPQTLKVLGVCGTVRAAIERFIPARFASQADITIGEFAKKRYGRRVLKNLVAPIVYGVHSADPLKLELRSLLPDLLKQLDSLGSSQAAVEALLQRRGAPKGSGAAVYSLKPSMAELPKAMAKVIVENGGEVVTASAVKAVKLVDEAWQVEAKSQYQAKNLVLATGPEISQKLLAEAVPQLAEKIVVAPATKVRLISLALESKELNTKPRGNGALVSPAAKKIRAKALTHATAKWEHTAKAAKAQHRDLHLVRLSYGKATNSVAVGSKVPSVSKFPHLALRDASMILGVPAKYLQLKAWAMTDWERVMRQSGPGHSAKLAELSKALDEYNRGKKSAKIELTGAWRAGNGLEAIARFSEQQVKQYLYPGL